MKNQKRYLFTLLLILTVGFAHAASASVFALDTVSDQELDTISVEEKNLRFSILGGPGYTPDFGVLVGGSALFTFKINEEIEAQKRSVVPVAFAVLFQGGLNLVSKPQLYFGPDRFRIFGTFIYKNTVENYYGIGYQSNRNTPRGETTTQHRTSGTKIAPILLFRLGDSDLFLGPSFDFLWEKLFNISDGVMNDVHYINQGGTADELSQYSTGIGLKLSYDTRDLPSNPYKGIYFDASHIYYSESFGGQYNYHATALEYRQYQSVGKRRVLAWVAKSDFKWGDVPITNHSEVGSPFDLRGYYLGQYRDKNSLYVLAEYRHMFNFDTSTKFGKFGSRLGFATWAGLGTIGPTIDQWDGVLPNYGLGLRIEVQPRMNFRMDYGRNPVNNENLIYFNMTEAF